VRAAIDDNPRFDIDTFEVDRLLGGADRPSYTVETLEHLVGASVFGTDRPGLILGADAAGALDNWHRPEKVLELAEVIVAARPGSDLGRVSRVFDGLGAKAPRVVEMPHIEISSTTVRERAAAGESIRYLVPERVRHIILSRGLYR